MATRGLHLMKGNRAVVGGGRMVDAACGNPNAILVGTYDEFMADGAHRCVKCAKSKTAALYARQRGGK